MQRGSSTSYMPVHGPKLVLLAVQIKKSKKLRRIVSYFIEYV